ncbi:hypothetical protein ABIQ69_03525 [Agromyces sp. G08B096]|uniref:Uncharacterized protein n=1 Tax=Agromyces sp. G08B096 TaxID=3156399 RepID=A0AAU7WBD7_9MICO
MSIMLAVMQPASLLSELLSILVAVAVIALLYTRESTRFFKDLAPDEPDVDAR